MSALPREVQANPREAYRLFRDNPAHPSLQFKRVSTREPIYSARVGLHYRVLGLLDGDTIAWGWIGPHAEYDKILKRL